MQTSTVDDESSAIDDLKARRLHNVLEQIRSSGLQDVGGSDKHSILRELHSFANTLNGIELPPAPATSSRRQDPERLQTYSDRLAQTRADLKLLEQLVSQTFHLPPQQSPAVYDSTRSDLTHQQSVIHSLLYSFINTAAICLRLQPFWLELEANLTRCSYTDNAGGCGPMFRY